MHGCWPPHRPTSRAGGTGSPCAARIAARSRSSPAVRQPGRRCGCPGQAGAGRKALPAARAAKVVHKPVLPGLVFVNLVPSDEAFAACSGRDVGRGRRDGGPIDRDCGDERIHGLGAGRAFDEEQRADGRGRRGRQDQRRRLCRFHRRAAGYGAGRRGCDLAVRSRDPRRRRSLRISTKRSSESRPWTTGDRGAHCPRTAGHRHGDSDPSRPSPDNADRGDRFRASAEAMPKRHGDERERSRRRDGAQPWRAWYKTSRWQALRWRVLVRDLFTCRTCNRIEVDTSRLGADPVSPHRGDERLFWDEANLQCLCKDCHDRVKQAEERSSMQTRGVWW